MTVAAPTGGAYWNVNSNANLGATQDATGIVFGAGNLTVAESDLRLIDDAVISVNSGSLATISSNITQDASPRQLHKVGAGTLRLSGSNNSFTGALAIGAGTVSVATLANANVASPIGQFASAGAAGLLLGGGTFQDTGGTTPTNRGFTLSGNSGIDVSAAGTTLP
ncbi:MAG: autotransporter-associated beta strand repeat-containing protein, partial [Akkermansiaceae bacterium]